MDIRKLAAEGRTDVNSVFGGRPFFADKLYEECLERKTFEPEPGICKRCSPQEKVLAGKSKLLLCEAIHNTPMLSDLGFGNRSNAGSYRGGLGCAAAPSKRT